MVAMLTAAHLAAALIEDTLRRLGAGDSPARDWSYWTVTAVLWLAAAAPLWLGPLADLFAGTRPRLPTLVLVVEPARASRGCGRLRHPSRPVVLRALEPGGAAGGLSTAAFAAVGIPCGGGHADTPACRAGAAARWSHGNRPRSRAGRHRAGGGPARSRSDPGLGRVEPSGPGHRGRGSPAISAQRGRGGGARRGRRQREDAARARCRPGFDQSHSIARRRDDHDGGATQRQGAREPRVAPFPVGVSVARVGGAAPGRRALRRIPSGGRRARAVAADRRRVFEHRRAGHRPPPDGVAGPAAAFRAAVACGGLRPHDRRQPRIACRRGIVSRRRRLRGPVLCHGDVGRRGRVAPRGNRRGAGRNASCGAVAGCATGPDLRVWYTVTRYSRSAPPRS